MAEQCAHPACTCEHEAEKMIRKDGRLYCSTHCVSADGDSDDCECGHPGCEG